VIFDPNTSQAALALAVAADVVVLALGTDRSVEYEGKDRAALTLPGQQEAFAQQVIATGKPVVLLLTNGGPVAIDTLMRGPAAIVEAFDPGFGAPMLARTLFGLENRWGKMPYTVYLNLFRPHFSHFRPIVFNAGELYASQIALSPPWKGAWLRSDVVLSGLNT
jgi:hypothetical protein